MTRYRLDYIGRTERALRTRSLDCANDDEAIDRVALIDYAGALELWREGEKIWRFEPRLTTHLSGRRT